MLLRLFGVSLVLCAVVVVGVSSSPICSGAVCHTTMDYPDHFTIYNGTIYTGIRNGIVQLTLGLEELQSVQSFDSVMNESCHRSANTINKDTNCHNYHRTIVFPRGDLTIVGKGSNASVNNTFIACSTNFLSPICQYRLISNLSLVKNQTGAGFCPQLAETGTAFVEFNTTLWVGTITDGAEDGAVSQSGTPFNGRVFHATIVNSVFWLKASSFVDMYEIGEYVYTFLREIPVEINPAEVRSRVARVCKSDAGVFTGRQQIFQTYLKSSIRCEVEGLSTAEQRYRDVSFFFNDLHDTTMVDRNGLKLLYGVFQNSGNGPIGSTVCVFSFDHTENDIATVFQGDYLTRSPSNVWSRSTNTNPNCSQGRTLQEAERNIVMYNDVEQMNSPSSPLYLKNGYRFQKIAVGRVTALDGNTYDVMFVAVQDDKGKMHIAKVSHVPQRNRQQSVEHDFIELNQSDYRVNHMQYYTSNGQDMLYVSTPARLMRINPFDCSAYLSCTECVASMDPYCAYDVVQGKCVGVNTANQNNLMQNVISGVADCPITAIPTPSSSIIISTSTNSLVIITPTTGPVGPEPNSGSNNNSSDMWEWLGIGGGAGFLIGLAIGIVVMFAWHRKVGVFSHCRDDGSRGGIDELGHEEDHKKSAADHCDNEPTKPGASNHFKSSPYHENGHIHHNGHLPNGHIPNGHCPPSVKSKNNYDVTDDPPSYDSKEAKCNRSQSLHQRRTSHPVKMLKMDESPQRMRSASMVPVTSEPVTNRDIARYGSNYSLDPESAKPTLTPKAQVHYDPVSDCVDLDHRHSLQKSTDC